MGLFKWIFRIVIVAILLVAATGAYLYLTDYAAEATVTEKGSDADGKYVIVSPKVYSYSYRVPLSDYEWNAVCKGNFVLYNVKSGHTRVFDHEGGDLIYETGKGIVNFAKVGKCAATGSA